MYILYHTVGTTRCLPVQLAMIVTQWYFLWPTCVRSAMFSDNIEHNVEVARDRVDDGVVQLEKASEYQNKYRKKVFIFLAILILFGVILGIIIWVSKRKKN